MADSSKYMLQEPDAVRDLVECCICLHNIIRIRYPGLHQGQMDVEDAQHNRIPGAWRETVNMDDVNRVVGPNRDTREAKQQREYLRLYFNSEVGSVPWQERMVRQT